MRLLSLLILAAWLCLAGGAVYAQSEGSPPADLPADGGTDAPADAPAPVDEAPTDQAPPAAPGGPVLQSADAAPVICDPARAGFRYLEVRGTGFDAYATQRLVGSLIDESGTPQIQWGSVWVSPQGRLTLEVNLCADPYRQRGALPVGNYTVGVGPGGATQIASTTFSLAPPPEPGTQGDTTAAPGPIGPVGLAARATLTAQPTSAVAASTPAATPTPNGQPTPTATPFPTLSLPSFAPTATPTPRTGPGSLSTPFPVGAPGLLVDGWEMVITGVTPDAYKGIHDELPSTVAPNSDQRDYMVRVQATYRGQTSGVFSGSRLALLSKTGEIYDQFKNDCGTVPDMIPPNLMTGGGSVRGNVCFTVRASDVGQLTLFDNQSTGNDRLYFNLQ